MKDEIVTIYGETVDGEVVAVDINDLLAHLEPDEREAFINSLFDDDDEKESEE